MVLFGFLIIGLSTIGFLATAKYYIFIIPIFIAIVHEKKIAFLWLSALLIIYFIYSFLYLNGILTPPIDVNTFINTKATWILDGFIIGSFTFVLILLMSNYRTTTTIHLKTIEQKNESLLNREKTLKQLNKKEKKLTEKLHKSLDKEKSLNELKSSLISVTSHEFRTPLSVILLSAEYITKYWDTLDDEKKLKRLEKIKSQVNHMKILMEDVLMAGKIEAGEVKCTPTLQNFNNFIYPIIDQLETSFNNTHKVNLINYNNDLNLFIDLPLGRRIFTNLLSNAIKYSPDANKILFEVTSTQKTSSFKITDFGLGMKSEILNTIFEPFKRGKNVESIQGTGLGLSIVKHAVELHNGNIEIESEINKGTCITITFPNKNN